MKDQKITIFTTKGCKGCHIMKNIIKEKLAVVSKPIQLLTYDVEEINNNSFAKYIADKVSVTDFPTTVFTDGIIILKVKVGTFPKSEVSELIDKHFV